MTPEEAQELMKQMGFECELILDKTVPMVKHPPTKNGRKALIIYAGLNGLACHIYEEGVILVPHPVEERSRIR